MRINKVVASYRYPTAGGKVKGAPKPEVFNRLADSVEVALREAASRFQVELPGRGAPAGNIDPIR